MIQACALVIFFLQISLQPVKTNEIPIYNVRRVSNIMPRSLITSIEKLGKKYCFFNSKWLECATNNVYDTMSSITRKLIGAHLLPHNDPRLHTKRPFKSHLSESQPIFRSFMPSPPGAMNTRPLTTLSGFLGSKLNPMHFPGFPSQLARPDVTHNMNTAWTPPLLHPQTTIGLSSPAQSTQVNSSSIVTHNQLKLPVTMTTAVAGVAQQIHKNLSAINKFTQSLDDLERRFYKVSFSTYFRNLIHYSLVITSPAFKTINKYIPMPAYRSQAIRATL